MAFAMFFLFGAVAVVHPTYVVGALVLIIASTLDVHIVLAFCHCWYTCRAAASEPVFFCWCAPPENVRFRFVTIHLLALEFGQRAAILGDFRRQGGFWVEGPGHLMIKHDALKDLGHGNIEDVDFFLTWYTGGHIHFKAILNRMVVVSSRVDRRRKRVRRWRYERGQRVRVGRHRRE